MRRRSSPTSGGSSTRTTSFPSFARSSMRAREGTRRRPLRRPRPGRARGEDQRRPGSGRARQAPWHAPRSRSRRQSSPRGPAGAGADDAPPQLAEEIRFADRLNHGILQLKVLPGNIRYMETVGFFWGGEKTERRLRQCDALPERRRRDHHRHAQERRRKPRGGPVHDQPLRRAEPADRDLLHARRKGRHVEEPCFASRRTR